MNPMFLSNTCGQLRKPNFTLTTLAAVTSLLFFSSAASALPQGASVVSGTASLSTNGNQLSVTNSPNAIVNWQSFSIEAGARVQFNQANAQSAVLNRVIGTDPSSILGQLASNGRVFLINPNGIVFGAGSQINVAGLVASTRDISNNDFLAGRNLFNAAPGNTANVANLGVIQTASGGSVYLVGQQASNGSGALIRADNGQVVLAAGQSVRIIDGNSPQVSLSVTAPENQAVNLGQIIASGGGIGLWAAQVRQAGQLNVDAVAGPGGTIVLKSTTGRTTLEGISTTSANASAGQGGTIQLLGNEVGLLNQASVQANGSTGGGTVLVGGDWQGANPNIANARAVYMAPEATIQANATHIGNGGKVVLWSDEATRVNGSLQAKGGSQGGNGGEIETSSHGYLDVSNIQSVDSSAAQGQAGQWLLDPNNITIQATGSNTNVGASPNFTSTNDSSIVTTGSIQAALNGGSSVTVQTGTGGTNAQAGDITWAANSPVTKSAGGDATLTLRAHRNIQINSGSNITSTAGKLNVVLNSDSQGVGSGWINTRGIITSNGGNITMGGGADPTTGFATATTSNPNPNNGAIQVGVLTGDLNSGSGNILTNGRVNFPSQNTAAQAVNLIGAISTTGGDITVNGLANVSTASSSNVGGIYVNSTISTSSGNINLTGVGLDYGVYSAFYSSAPGIATANGNLTIDGTASRVAASFTQSGGVHLASAASAPNGQLTINATGTNGALGLFMTYSNSGAIVSGATGVTGRTVVINASSDTNAAFLSSESDPNKIVAQPGGSVTINATSGIADGVLTNCGGGCPSYIPTTGATMVLGPADYSQSGIVGAPGATITINATNTSTGSALAILSAGAPVGGPSTSALNINASSAGSAPTIINTGAISSANTTITATNTGTGLALQNFRTDTTTGVVTPGTIGSTGGRTRITGAGAGGQPTVSSPGSLLGTVVLAGNALNAGTFTPTTVVLQNGGLSIVNLINVPPATLADVVNVTPSILSLTPITVLATLTPAQLQALGLGAIAALTPEQRVFLYSSGLYTQLSPLAQAALLAGLQLPTRYAASQTVTNNTLEAVRLNAAQTLSKPNRASMRPSAVATNCVVTSSAASTNQAQPDDRLYKNVIASYDSTTNTLKLKGCQTGRF